MSKPKTSTSTPSTSPNKSHKNPSKKPHKRPGKPRPHEIKARAFRLAQQQDQKNKSQPEELSRQMSLIHKFNLVTTDGTLTEHGKLIRNLPINNIRFANLLASTLESPDLPSQTKEVLTVISALDTDSFYKFRRPKKGNESYSDLTAEFLNTEALEKYDLEVNKYSDLATLYDVFRKYRSLPTTEKKQFCLDLSLNKYALDQVEKNLAHILKNKNVRSGNINIENLQSITGDQWLPIFRAFIDSGSFQKMKMHKEYHHQRRKPFITSTDHLDNTKYALFYNATKADIMPKQNLYFGDKGEQIIFGVADQDRALKSDPNKYIRPVSVVALSLPDEYYSAFYKQDAESDLINYVQKDIGRHQLIDCITDNLDPFDHRPSIFDANENMKYFLDHLSSIYDELHKKLPDITYKRLARDLLRKIDPQQNQAYSQYSFQKLLAERLEHQSPSDIIAVANYMSDTEMAEYNSTHPSQITVQGYTADVFYDEDQASLVFHSPNLDLKVGDVVDLSQIPIFNINVSDIQDQLPSNPQSLHIVQYIIINNKTIKLEHVHRSSDVLADLHEKFKKELVEILVSLPERELPVTSLSALADLASNYNVADFMRDNIEIDLIHFSDEQSPRKGFIDLRNSEALIVKESIKSSPPLFRDRLLNPVLPLFHKILKKDLKNLYSKTEIASGTEIRIDHFVSRNTALIEKRLTTVDLKSMQQLADDLKEIFVAEEALEIDRRKERQDPYTISEIELIEMGEILGAEMGRPRGTERLRALAEFSDATSHPDDISATDLITNQHICLTTIITPAETATVDNTNLNSWNLTLDTPDANNHTTYTRLPKLAALIYNNTISRLQEASSKLDILRNIDFSDPDLIYQGKKVSAKVKKSLVDIYKMETNCLRDIKSDPLSIYRRSQILLDRIAEVYKALGISNTTESRDEKLARLVEEAEQINILHISALQGDHDTTPAELEGKYLDLIEEIDRLREQTCQSTTS